MRREMIRVGYAAGCAHTVRLSATGVGQVTEYDLRYERRTVC